MNRVWPVVTAIGVFLVASCGGNGDSATTAVDSSTGDESTIEVDETGEGEQEDPATDLAEDLTEDLEETQAAQGGGSATFSVGDQTWTFDSVVCAVGEEETGQEGAELVLSSIQDGLQMYVSIDSFGHSITLDDIEDFENPVVSLSSTGDDFVSVDGKSISAQAEFTDGTSDDFTSTTPGTFQGVCP